MGGSRTLVSQKQILHTAVAEHLIIFIIVTLWSLWTCFKSFSRVSSGLHASSVVLSLKGLIGLRAEKKTAEDGQQQQQQNKWHTVSQVEFSEDFFLN